MIESSRKELEQRLHDIREALTQVQVDPETRILMEHLALEIEALLIQKTGETKEVGTVDREPVPISCRPKTHSGPKDRVINVNSDKQRSQEKS